MAILKMSTTLRNAKANQIETVVNTTPKLRIMSGTMPVDCAAADSGTLLCEIALSTNFMSSASNGVKNKFGTWAGTALPAAGAGTNASYFRLKSGTTTHLQGNISAFGGSGAMVLDDITLVEGEAVIVNTFTLIEGNG